MKGNVYNVSCGEVFILFLCWEWLITFVKRKWKCQLLSPVQLFAAPWTVAHQAPPPMGFHRQKYWSGLLCPPPGDLPNAGIKPRLPHFRYILYSRSHYCNSISKYTFPQAVKLEFCHIESSEDKSDYLWIKLYWEHLGLPRWY